MLIFGYLDFNYLFILDIDESNVLIGVVLLLNIDGIKRVVVYVSWILIK